MRVAIMSIDLKKPLLPQMTRELSSWNFKRGMRVRVTTESSRLSGKVGIVAELIDGGKIGVTFPDERVATCFEQSELRRVP